jgi:hypothetical protein
LHDAGQAFVDFQGLRPGRSELEDGPDFAKVRGQVVELGRFT